MTRPPGLEGDLDMWDQCLNQTNHQKLNLAGSKTNCDESESADHQECSLGALSACA